MLTCAALPSVRPGYIYLEAIQDIPKGSELFSKFYLYPLLEEDPLDENLDASNLPPAMPTGPRPTGPPDASALDSFDAGFD